MNVNVINATNGKRLSATGAGVARHHSAGAPLAEVATGRLVNICHSTESLTQ